MKPSISKALFNAFFLVLLFIGSYALADLEDNSGCSTKNEPLADQLKSEENFFDSIRSFNYFLNWHELSSVSYFDDHEQGIRNCTIATVEWTYASVEPKDRNWTTLGTVSLNFSNYEYKETEVFTGLFFTNTILMTLLKSKENNKVYIDLTLMYDSMKSNNQRFEVGSSMWYDNKKPIALIHGIYFFEIFYESPEGNKILHLSNPFYESTTKEVLPEFSWSEIDRIYSTYDHDNRLAKTAVLSHRYSNLTLYTRHRDYNNEFHWNFQNTISLKHLNIPKPDDFQIEIFSAYQEPDRGLISVTSIEEKRTHLILLEQRRVWTVIANMSIKLEPNVNKVGTHVHGFHAENIDVYQVQCQPETGNCKILWQKVDRENKIIERDPEFESFNATDCMLTDMYHEKYLSDTILYFCKKHVDFGYNKDIDYGLVKCIDYRKNAEMRDLFSLNLNFFGDSKSLNCHEEKYKKLLLEMNDF